jgi:hypothetical protein
MLRYVQTAVRNQNFTWDELTFVHKKFYEEEVHNLDVHQIL